MTTAEVDGCALAPLVYPLRPLHTTLEGQRLVKLVRETGLSSIAGLPLSTSAAETQLAVVDAEFIKDLQATCLRELSATATPLSTAYAYATTWPVTRLPEMETRLGASGTTDVQRQEARTFLKSEYQKQLTDVFVRMKALGEDRRVASFQFFKGALSGKLTMARKLWESTPAQGTSTDTAGTLVPQAFGLVNKFIDHVAYGQRHDVDNAASQARKDKFMKAVAARCMVAPKDAWRQLLLRYLKGVDGYDGPALMGRAKSCGAAVGSRVQFFARYGVELPRGGN
jgi:hypothetical protein